MWKNKKVLVTGSEGLIGKELVEQLNNLGAIVYCADLKLGQNLKHYKNCLTLTEGIDYVFHLAGVKGNPKMTKERPIDFMGPMLQFDTNMILASQENYVKRFLYTSSIAVENPESDKYPAWAKQTAETLIEAMRIQYSDTKYCIVRPANVYGTEDLSRDNLMVVSSLIKSAKRDGKLVMDLKGSEQVRDIIHARDVAKGMIKCMENMPDYPVNLCSGKETKIKDIAEIISKELNIPIEYTNLNLILGPQKKVMRDPYILPEVTLEQGIKEVINDNRDTTS